MSASPASIIPSHAGANLAELSPLLKLGEGRKDTSTSLQEAIRERFVHFNSLESETRNEMIRAGEETALFMQGKQYLTQNPWIKGGWLTVKANPSTQNQVVKRALSMMQYHTSGNLEKWLSSNPDILITPGVESDDAYESAQAAKIIVNHYEKKFFANKARLQIEECLEGLTFGSYIWRLGFDDSLKTITAYRQIFENKTVKIGPGWGKCGDCGMEGGEADFNQVEDTYLCPKCHSEAMVIPAASGEMPSLARTEPVDLGDFTLSLESFANCKWDLRVHADESSWFIIRKRTTMSAVRQILGNIQFNEGEGKNDVGLDVADHLAYSGTAQAGYSNSRERPTLYKEPATIEEFWMSPAEYGDIILSKPTKTISGFEIPSGVRLGEVFKGQNVCALGLNEISTLLGLFPEDHKDYVFQGKWYAKKGSGAGRGLQDLTEVQKVFNSDHNTIQSHLRAGASPSMLAVMEAIGEEYRSQVGQPGKIIPISLAAVTEGMKLNELVTPAFQPTSTSGQLFEFTYNRLSEFAQFASHFLPFTGGIPGVDNSTATGANITQAATDALYTPPLSVKGEVRQGIFEKLIKQYPKRFPIDREFPLGGKYSSHTGSYLVKANLCTDLTFEVVRDSWLPRNSYRKQQAYAGFIQMFGGFLGYLQARTQDPARVDDIVRAFDLELESEERNVAHSLCFRRVRQMQQAANLISDPFMLVGVQVAVDQMGQPTNQLMSTGQGVIQPPVSQAEPSHEIKRQWLMEWLDSDSGLSSPMVMRKAVELLILLHTQYSGSQQSLMAFQAGQVQVAGQRPMVEAQQQAQAANAQQGLDVQAQQLQLEGARELGRQAIERGDLKTQAAEHGMEQQHAATMNDLRAQDRGAALQTKVADREHALAVQNARQQ